MAHKTKIGGTAYEIGSGKVLVGGTGYSIDKGRTKVDGTGYDISFTLTVGSLPLGSIVKLGAKSYGQSFTREFIVVNQGIPQESDYYDETADGTWLLSKNVLSTRQQGGDAGLYQNSSLRAYLEDMYYKDFTDIVKSATKEVRIPYVYNTSGTLKYGASGLASKCFALSAREVGITSTMLSGLKNEGARLDYFRNIDVDPNRIGYDSNGSVLNWWLRSPIIGTVYDVCVVNTDGKYSSLNYFSSAGTRPALVLHKDTPLDENFNVIA